MSSVSVLWTSIQYADEERLEKRAYMKFEKIAKNSTMRMTKNLLVKYGYKDAFVRINLMYQVLGFEKYTLKILVMKGIAERTVRTRT